MSDAPPAGDTSAPTPRSDDTDDRRTTWLIVLGVLIVLLLAGILAVLLFRDGEETATTGGGSTTSTTTASTTTTTAAPSVGPSTTVTSSAPPASSTTTTAAPTGAACEPGALVGGYVGGVPVRVVEYACTVPGEQHYAWALVEATDEVLDPLHVFLEDVGDRWKILDYGTGIVCEDAIPASACDQLPGAPRA